MELFKKSIYYVKMRFSVVIPLYNKAKYVKKAIGSVLAQTISDYELVIVDDGSTDGSTEIAEKIIDGQLNCKLIIQENAGVSVARNNGVAASTGDYLCFLDADDWWNPGFLEEMSKFVKEFPDAGIYGTNYTIVNETKHKTRIAKIGVDEGFEKGCIDYCKVYAKTMYMPLWTGAVCIPRLVFEAMGGFPKGIKLGEDFLLWIRIALKYKVAFLNKPLAYYNQDVETANRGVGKLYQPQEHFFWNLDWLKDDENSNADYKQLIDNLRIYNLQPYLLDVCCRRAALMELDKVDWSKQSTYRKMLLHMPLLLLRIRHFFLKICCIVGTKIRKGKICLQ